MLCAESGSPLAHVCRSAGRDGQSNRARVGDSLAALHTRTRVKGLSLTKREPIHAHKGSPRSSGRDRAGWSANHMAKSNLKLVSPATENRTVTPLRRLNSELRPREHLTEREVKKLIEAAKRNRWGARDSAMILTAFRHGLRASELCGLQWSDVEFETATLHLRRAKGGTTATHPLRNPPIFRSCSRQSSSW
jgi:integrase